MSRRKQSCPRPVKGPNKSLDPGESSTNQSPPHDNTTFHNDFNITTARIDDDDHDDTEDNNSRGVTTTITVLRNDGNDNDNDNNDDDFIHSYDKLVIALSPKPDNEDEDRRQLYEPVRRVDLNINNNNNSNNSNNTTSNNNNNHDNINDGRFGSNVRDGRVHTRDTPNPNQIRSHPPSSHHHRPSPAPPSLGGDSRNVNRKHTTSTAAMFEGGYLPGLGDPPEAGQLTSHHHLFSPKASTSNQPPPNFLLQQSPPPPPPPQQQKPQRKPRDLLAPPPPPTANPKARNPIPSNLLPHGVALPFQHPQRHPPHPSVAALLSNPSLLSSLSSSIPPNILDEMARRKRSPNSIRWNHPGMAQTAHPEAELIQCQTCMTQIRVCGDLKTPIEQVDYFVDDDGTLTIKNDICPRTVALSLLCGDHQSQKTFKQRLGEDYNMFILNLEQILKKHPQTCPGELASQVARAGDLIQEHHLRQKLLSHSRKRTHDFMSHGDVSDRVDPNTIKASQPEAILTIQKDDEDEDDEEKEGASGGLPDNFLSIPPSREQTPPLNLNRNPESDNDNLPLDNIPKSIFDCDNNNNTHSNNDNIPDVLDNTPSKEEGLQGGDSRSVSPASLISQGMTVAEAAIANKQMANTKRGSKILPVAASTDGQVKYQCPICSLELSGEHELTVHIRSHNQSHLQVMPNTCTICGKTLSSQSSLDRHMLVHSGERPFKCSICDMSFTTNGNMHRHSRIHQKNGINIKPIGRKSESKSSKNSTNNSSNNHNSSQSSSASSLSAAAAASSSSASSSMQPQFPSAFRDDLSTPKRKGGHHANAPSTPQPDQNVEFLHYMNDMKNQQLKLLSMSNYMYPFSAAPATHSAFPMSPYVHEQLRLHYLQAFMNPLNGESMAKRPRFPPYMVAPPRAPSPDLREPEVHRCRECGEEFSNQFAYEAHLESHVIVDEKMEAEAGTACKTCKTVAKSAESLLLHTLTHHKPQDDVTMPDIESDPSESNNQTARESSSPSSPSTSEMETDALPNQQPAPPNEILEIEKKPSSFINLGFADCTTKKFPLIAKAFCEDNPDLKGKKFPVFKCRHCEKEFPVEGAKDLHEASHVPEEYTKCPKCNCHFSDSSRLQEHMLKHVSDLKFEESLKKVETKADCDEAESSENMSQNYFLAQFGLITSEDHATEAVVKCESEGNFDDESILNGSENNDDPVESVMSEDMDCRMTSDNEDDALSSTSETKILTIPIRNNNNNNDVNKKDEMRTNKTERGLQGSEIMTDVAAMHAGRSPASSSMGSDSLSFPVRLPQDTGPLLMLPTAKSNKDQQTLPPIFPCKYCDAVLSSAADLKNHQILHKDSSSSSSPFQCKVCPYASTDKSTLLRHMRTHNGERPYKCKLCDYSFTTKANCERHLRQKHNLDKQDLKDQLIHRQFDVQQLLQKGNNFTIVKAGSSSSSSSSQGKQLSSAVCKSCGVDFFHVVSLQQHIHLNKECRYIYGCKSCMMTFPTKLGISHHMTVKHSNASADKIGQYFTKIENTPTPNDTTESSPPTPPPAHAKPSSSSPSKKLLTETEGTAALSLSSPGSGNVLDKVSPTGTKLLKSYLTARSNARTNTIVTNPALHLMQSPQPLAPPSLVIKPEPEESHQSHSHSPLNFTKSLDQAPPPHPQSSSTPLNKKSQNNNDDIPSDKDEEEHETSSSVFDEQPLDLSVSRSSSPTSSSSSVHLVLDHSKGQGQGHANSGSSSSATSSMSGSPTKQAFKGFGPPLPHTPSSHIKRETGTSQPPPSHFLSTGHDIRNSLGNRNSRPNKNNSPFPRNPFQTEGKNTKTNESQQQQRAHLSSIMSSLFPSKKRPVSSSPLPSSLRGMSPIKQTTTGGPAPAPAPTHASAPPFLLKHPAFPQFLPLMSSLGLTPDGRPQQVISPLSPNSRPSSTSSPGNTGTRDTNRRKRTVTPDKSSFHVLGGNTGSSSDMKISMQAMQPSVILTDLKERKSKGSSSESESSCELSSVSKMLTATDAQTFQEYLTIPETEDEQDSVSVSEMSGEDSNLSMEHLFSNSFLQAQRARLAQMAGETAPAAGRIERKQDGCGEMDDEPGAEDEEEEQKVKDDDANSDANGEEVTTFTVGMALLAGNPAPSGLNTKPLLLDDKREGKHPDPSNMSEQEIARLIEKVTRENDNCPTKKKRNSYADSPHKFQCPYCPRCFPWMSSLNRHLLTHTGQKPFRCPRCPVTFSTKSNRERHLIRKHNVNMLDPSSRATMDRPYKCQLCVFSSFSTKSNLIKHYRDRHDGASPPLKALEGFDGVEDPDVEMDGDGKTCEEEEEEYALAQKMQESGLLQGLYSDNHENGCDNHSSLTSRDPHKKRNVLFDLSQPDRSKSITAKTSLFNSLQNGDNSSNSVGTHTILTFPNSARDQNNAKGSPSSAMKSSSSSSSTSVSSSSAISAATNLPGIDQTVLSDTVRKFLDKSLQQSLEDSQRKAQEEGSTFWITPAMERHLRRLDQQANLSDDNVPRKGMTSASSSASPPSSSPTSLPVSSQGLTCHLCNLEFPSKKKLQKHLRIHKSDTASCPYSCHLCDDVSFPTRVECLQHLAVLHPADWKILEEHNAIRNVEVFATRLDKMVLKSHKREKSVSNQSIEDPKNMHGQETEQENHDLVVFGDGTKHDEDNNNNNNNLTSNTKSDETKRIFCALCPDKFLSRRELQDHMSSSHIGSLDNPKPQPPTNTPSLLLPPCSLSRPSASSSSSLPSSTSATPTTAPEGSSSATNQPKDREAGEVTDGGNLDLLHNLLGVESSTIDEIFEAKVSAASILGDSGGKGDKP